MLKVRTLFRGFVTDHFSISVSGWFFQENPIRGMLATTLLSTMVDDIDARRVSYFTASGKRDRSLCLDGLKHEMCTKTDGEGLIEQQFQVTNAGIEQFREPGGVGGKVEYSVSTIDKSVQAKGEIFLCDDHGISIISDIVSVSVETERERQNLSLCSSEQRMTRSKSPV